MRRMRVNADPNAQLAHLLRLPKSTRASPLQESRFLLEPWSSCAHVSASSRSSKGTISSRHPGREHALSAGNPRNYSGSGEKMRNLIKLALLTVVVAFGASVAANATPCPSTRPNCNTSPAPEVDPSLAGAGIALLGGTLVVLRARRRKDPQ